MFSKAFLGLCGRGLNWNQTAVNCNDQTAWSEGAPMQTSFQTIEEANLPYSILNYLWVISNEFVNKDLGNYIL